MPCLTFPSRPPAFPAPSHSRSRRCNSQTPYPSYIAMSPVLRTVLMLIASNVFMTFAWYGHLRHMEDKKWYIAALVSWGIACSNTCEVPANRLGHRGHVGRPVENPARSHHPQCLYSLLPVFMKERLNWSFLWAGLCMVRRCTSCSTNKFGGSIIFGHSSASFTFCATTSIPSQFRRRGSRVLAHEWHNRGHHRDVAPSGSHNPAA